MSARRRLAIALGALLAASGAPGCLQVDSFFFAGEPIDDYRWDEPAPELDGDLTDPHASIVTAADRREGFATLADGAEIHWVFARRPGGASTTILYSHGNGPNLGRFWDRVEALWSAGFHVLTYDYPGYGRSTGSATERGLYDAIDAVWDEVVPAIPEIDPGAVVLYGYSLGAGPTFHLAARTLHDDVAPRGVVTESAWCSIAAQIRDGATFDLPPTLLTHLAIDNCARAAEIRGSRAITLLHGTEDVVALPRQARLLAEASGGGAVLVLVEHARHADLPVVAVDSYPDLVRAAVDRAIAGP